MLQELSINNLALIAKLNLTFKSGFTTLTGETGAGKSILLDGLGLALGARANSSLVRHNTNRADISADFNIYKLKNIQQWLIENELDDDNNCLLRRTLSADGRSKAYINSLPVSVNQLKKLGSLLLNIHGQRDHQFLLNTSTQLELLDNYAQHHNLTTKVACTYQQWANLNSNLQQLIDEQADKQSKLELLEFQLQEFNNINPVENEFEQLSSEQKTLSHANEIKQALNYAYQAMDGNNGVTNNFNLAIVQLEKISQYNPQLNTLLSQLNSALIDSEEIANDIHAEELQIELDPTKLQHLEQRLAELFNLSKKYQIEPNNLVTKYTEIQQSIAQLNNQTQSLQRLKADLTTAWQDYIKTATTLSLSRQKTANILRNTITKAMQTLGMADGEFTIELTKTENYSSKGLDAIQFLISTNKGQPAQALNKVASGGELSRISLAIQVACAEITSLPTLIFDEIDVGIGGAIAQIVGQKMQQLGKHCQVLSITHLGQVAAYGNQQLNISKSSTNNNTTTTVIELTHKQRIIEIARMVGGVEITEQTNKHATEILHTAQKTSL